MATCDPVAAFRQFGVQHLRRQLDEEVAEHNTTLLRLLESQAAAAVQACAAGELREALELAEDDIRALTEANGGHEREIERLNDALANRVPVRVRTELDISVELPGDCSPTFELGAGLADCIQKALAAKLAGG